MLTFVLVFACCLDSVFYGFCEDVDIYIFHFFKFDAISGDGGFAYFFAVGVG